ncbi:MAG: hypothetical protein ABI859_07105 [Pseudomonadota bacterium]
MNKLSEWLDVMLGEIARKQDEAARAAVEMARRETEQGREIPPAQTAPTPARLP